MSSSVSKCCTTALHKFTTILNYFICTLREVVPVDVRPLNLPQLATRMNLYIYSCTHYTSSTDSRRWTLKFLSVGYKYELVYIYSTLNIATKRWVTSSPANNRCLDWQLVMCVSVTDRRQQCEIWSYSPANHPVICPETGQVYNRHARARDRIYVDQAGHFEWVVNICIFNNRFTLFIKIIFGNEMGGINYAKQLLCKTSTANLELTLRPCKCNISSCRKRCPLSLSIKTDPFTSIHSWSFTW